MPYTFSIYPFELKPGKFQKEIPKVGDIFVVTKIDENVTDMHWGQCISVELVPEAEFEKDEKS